MKTENFRAETVKWCTIWRMIPYFNVTIMVAVCSGFLVCASAKAVELPTLVHAMTIGDASVVVGIAGTAERKELPLSAKH